jgi:hypothetical protein
MCCNAASGALISRDLGLEAGVLPLAPTAAAAAPDDELLTLLLPPIVRMSFSEMGWLAVAVAALLLTGAASSAA